MVVYQVRKIDEQKHGKRVEVNRIKKMKMILHFGNHQKKMNLVGTLLGGMVDQVGI